MDLHDQMILASLTEEQRARLLAPEPEETNGEIDASDD